jgi:hypothetical protein
MSNKVDGVRWLEKRTEEYCLGRNDTKEVVDDFDEVGKLGRGFSSVDKLEEVNIGGNGVWHPTCISENLMPTQKGRYKHYLDTL